MDKEILEGLGALVRHAGERIHVTLQGNASAVQSVASALSAKAEDYVNDVAKHGAWSLTHSLRWRWPGRSGLCVTLRSTSRYFPCICMSNKQLIGQMDAKNLRLTRHVDVVRN